MSFIERLKRNKVLALFAKSMDEFNTDNGNLLAAAVSYSLLFSLFPFALAVISIAGFFMTSSEFEAEVITSLANLLPVARNLIVTTLNGVVSERAATGIIALAGLIWSATSFFDALRRSLNATWHVKHPQTFIKGQLTDFSMMIFAFIAFIGFIWITTSVNFIHETNMQSALPRFMRSLLFSRIIFAVLSALLAFLVILLLYKFVPSQRPQWKDIWPGALVAAVGFEIIRFGFIWYVKNFSTYNLVYGSIGTVIALLAFIYFTAWILLFTAKLTAVQLRMKTNSNNCVNP